MSSISEILFIRVLFWSWALSSCFSSFWICSDFSLIVARYFLYFYFEIPPLSLLLFWFTNFYTSCIFSCKCLHFYFSYYNSYSFSSRRFFHLDSSSDSWFECCLLLVSIVSLRDFSFEVISAILLLCYFKRLSYFSMALLRSPFKSSKSIGFTNIFLRFNSDLVWSSSVLRELVSTWNKFYFSLRMYSKLRFFLFHSSIYSWFSEMMMLSFRMC